MFLNFFSNFIRKYGLYFFVGLVFLFLYIPIIVLVVFSFNDSAAACCWKGFTFEWYYKLFETEEIWPAMMNSIIVACSAAVLSIVMSTLLIQGLSTRFSYLISIFYSTMMIPDIIISVALLVFFSLFSVPLGLTTLIAGHTLLGLGISVPIIYTRYSEMDNQIVEASLNLGATDSQTFFKVVLPFLSPALFSAALSVFILSFDDFLISFFCSGPTSQTLSLYIFAIIRSGVSPLINALSTLMLVMSTCLLIIFSFLRIKIERLKND